ncbi:MAG: mandelate racemase/muconate lactonizing protein [Chloroflexi bacterium]|nr:mandelate racemase/muconate lactonizing protein [Chloroflexota bacterium]MCY3583771.1 mandelate racemase/muconate lactonizing protein [Chloroflexota bacterium]MCY3716209.1 mandelate racemase/muconate lactonizing protein [Chloroflexota bacterium]MDE2650836.1 mandelate racemase/muconate lactonizing protein [Chloroflexota bacterium]MXX83009.1 mandelate racemase/muconate lactonizing protein [Chloroflexota bacterium]
MRIDRVRALHVRGQWDYHEPLAEAHLARPAAIYPELAGKVNFPVDPAAGPPYELERRFLLIDTDQGATGICGALSDEDCAIINRTFADLLIGEDPQAVERIWDKMYRHAIHGRKGAAMLALSKVDLALWDLKGKLLGAPVYQLLGGPTRSKIKAYASMLGYSVEPNKVIERTRHFAAQGFTAFKWFLPGVPHHGEAGIRRNLSIIRAAREAAGPDADIMFDAWSSWNVPFTQRMIELSAPYRPTWFEEPVLADLIPQYAELRRGARGVFISGGEHEYTRWGIKALLDAQAVHILQPDVTWAGGLSEMTKICALASAYAIPVIPHHGGWASTHLIASQTITTCPMQEWLFLAGRPDNVFYKHKLVPVDGHIHLPSAPGLSMDMADGLELLAEYVLAG